MRRDAAVPRSAAARRWAALALAVVGGALAPPGPAAGAAPAVPSNEDLRHVRTLALPQVAPDGRRVLLQVAEATADGGLTHLWLIDATGAAAPRQITWSSGGDKRGEHDGRWMPDGREILFLAKRGEHTQLYRLPLDGGEAHALDLRVAPRAAAPDDGDAPLGGAADAPAEPTTVAIDIDDYAIAPDGRSVALVARDPDTAAEKKRQDDRDDAVRVDHDAHGKRLYLLDPASARLEAAGVPADLAAVFWNPAGDRLVAVTEAPGNAADLAPARAAWRVERADPGHPVPLPQVPATVYDGAWSSDGRQFAFRAQARADTPPGYLDLYTLDLATGRIRDLSDGLTATIAGAPPLAFGTGLLQSVELGLQRPMMRFEGGRRTLVEFDSAVVSDLHCNATQGACAWLGSGSGQPPALYVAARPGRAARALPTPAVLPAAWPLAAAHPVHWNSEGRSIEGLLYLPAATAGDRVPLVVDVHGGPTGAWQDRFNPFADFLVAQGWAVLEPNPRGSTGYGADFAAANRNDLGGGDLRDILAGVDAMLRDHPIDPQRLALIGYSYGGEMAGFAEGRTDRFKAIVSAAPVIDQHSEYGTEDVSWYDRWFYGKPWEHPEDAWRQSPLSTVAHARTPFLLLQGEADRIDPLGQSLEMYRALRQAGVPVELVQYPREDHGPLAEGLYGGASTEPWHGFDARRRIVRFIGAAFAPAAGH